MKKRLDFVTNSSSSSYICDVCGHAEGGFDLCLSDVNMCECEYGHIICTEHTLIDVSSYEGRAKSYLASLDPVKCTELLAEYNAATIDDLEDDDFESICNDCGLYSDYVGSSACPICQMKNISYDDLHQYMVAKSGKPQSAIESEIQNNFLTYEDFVNYIRKNFKK